MKRFRAEASMLAKLNHPAIATIYELHRSDEDLLMVMEFVPGESLDQFVQRNGPVEPERAAYLLAQVLDAIGHAHAAGIIHRDLKPSNVMVTERGAVKIMDFGIARVRGAEHMTTDGYMMGTPAYMSPEQVLCQDVDGRSDLYSVGVMFYRLLTGKLPFEADTAIGMVQKQISDAPTPARLHRADLPSWAVAIVDRALAKSPADRYQTAEELRKALLDAIHDAAWKRRRWCCRPWRGTRDGPLRGARIPTQRPRSPQRRHVRRRQNSSWCRDAPPHLVRPRVRRRRPLRRQPRRSRPRSRTEACACRSNERIEPGRGARRGCPGRRRNARHSDRGLEAIADTRTNANAVRVAETVVASPVAAPPAATADITPAAAEPATPPATPALPAVVAGGRHRVRTSSARLPGTSPSAGSAGTSRGTR
jgi:serine/threonine protein kinase